MRSTTALLFAAVAVGNAEPLQLLLYTPINVDGNSTTASTTLQLRNLDATAANHTLAIQNSVSKNTGKDGDWVVTFYGLDNKPVGPMLTATFASQDPVPIKVDLAHLVEAGETTADLFSDGQKIGEIRAAKDSNLPFKISLEGNPPEKPEIEFVKGSSIHLRLKNDDSMS